VVVIVMCYLMYWLVFINADLAAGYHLHQLGCVELHQDGRRRHHRLTIYDSLDQMKHDRLHGLPVLAIRVRSNSIFSPSEIPSYGINLK